MRIRSDYVRSSQSSKLTFHRLIIFLTRLYTMSEPIKYLLIPGFLTSDEEIKLMILSAKKFEALTH